MVGGGAGGCGTVNKFVSKFREGEVCVIGQCKGGVSRSSITFGIRNNKFRMFYLLDPASEHFNQSMWTLVGEFISSIDKIGGGDGYGGNSGW